MGGGSYERRQHEAVDTTILTALFSPASMSFNSAEFEPV